MNLVHGENKNKKMKKIDLKGLSIKMTQDQMKMVLGGGSGQPTFPDGTPGRYDSMGHVVRI
ncbi:MAG: hypothetical protein E7076_04480 [Bacteroidales bacterium]|nr:hypothetical protein [Bacteroidales bacterium]